ncbi:MAG: metallophosphoesterase family protein [Thermoprotei archaeon]
MEEIVNIVRNVAKTLNTSYSSLKYRLPGFYEILDFDEVFVLGDLHGDFNTLIDFMSNTKVLEKLENSNTKLVFLGDYIDRGGEQLETLVAVLLLKTMYPDKVILLRGNHEPPPDLIPYPHDFPEQLYLRFGNRASVLYSVFLSIFQKLPYASRIPDKILLLHGGPPRRVLYSKSFEEAFSIGQPCVDDQVLEDIIWSDPIDGVEEPIGVSPRGAGIVFGEELSRKTIELANVQYIVRGHEAVNGYSTAHEGIVITIFSSKMPYGLDRAGYLHITKDKPLDDIISCCINTI